MDWIDFFGILIWMIIIRVYYRYVTKQTNTTNEKEKQESNDSCFMENSD